MSLYQHFHLLSYEVCPCTWQDKLFETKQKFDGDDNLGTIPLVWKKYIRYTNLCKCIKKCSTNSRSTRHFLANCCQNATVWNDSNLIEKLICLRWKMKKFTSIKLLMRGNHIYIPPHNKSNSKLMLQDHEIMKGRAKLTMTLAHWQTRVIWTCYSIYFPIILKLKILLFYSFEERENRREQQRERGRSRLNIQFPPLFDFSIFF